MKWEAVQLPVGDKHPKPSEQLLKHPETLGQRDGMDAIRIYAFHRRSQPAIKLTFQASCEYAVNWGCLSLAGTFKISPTKVTCNKESYHLHHA